MAFVLCISLAPHVAFADDTSSTGELDVGKHSTPVSQVDGQQKASKNHQLGNVKVQENAATKTSLDSNVTNSSNKNTSMNADSEKSGTGEASQSRNATNKDAQSALDSNNKEKENSSSIQGKASNNVNGANKLLNVKPESSLKLFQASGVNLPNIPDLSGDGKTPSDVCVNKPLEPYQYGAQPLFYSAADLADGTYSVSANVSMLTPIGVRGYTTSPTNPMGIGPNQGIPSTPMKYNAKLVVNGGKYNLSLDLLNPVFTIQKVTSSEGVTVTNTHSSPIPKAPEITGMVHNIAISSPDGPKNRIDHVDMELKNHTGLYQFGKGRSGWLAFATALNSWIPNCDSDRAHSLDITVDLKNARLLAQAENSKTFTNNANQTSVTLKFTKQSTQRDLLNSQTFTANASLVTNEQEIQYWINAAQSYYPSITQQTVPQIFSLKALNANKEVTFDLGMSAEVKLPLTSNSDKVLFLDKNGVHELTSTIKEDSNKYFATTNVDNSGIFFITSTKAIDLKQGVIQSQVDDATGVYATFSYATPSNAMDKTSVAFRYGMMESNKLVVKKNTVPDVQSYGIKGALDATAYSVAFYSTVGMPTPIDRKNIATQPIALNMTYTLPVTTPNAKVFAVIKDDAGKVLGKQELDTNLFGNKVNVSLSKNQAKLNTLLQSVGCPEDTEKHNNGSTFDAMLFYSAFSANLPSELDKLGEEYPPILQNGKALRASLMVVNIAENHSSTTPEPKNKVIKFKDSFLKLILLQNLKKYKIVTPQTKDITVQDAKKLKVLTLPFALNIKQLDGLEYFTGLEELTLMRSRVVDFKPISKLKNLTTLNLSLNKITDISPLQNLTNLRNLYLSTNKITDILPLQNLTNLQTLQVSSNPIADITSLSGLTNLTNLAIGSLKIKDLAPLQNLTNLESLTIDSNKLENIDALSHLVKLKKISAYQAELPDLKPLGNLVNLKNLNMYKAHISDISPFTNLSNLEVLDINDTEVSDIAPLANLTKLKELSVDLKKIEDRAQLCSLKSLTKFNGLDFKIPYCVTFKVDGAFFEHFAVDQNCSIETSLYENKLFPTAPIKQGFTFKEWNTQPDGNGDQFDKKTIVTANKDVYAIYTENNTQPVTPPAPEPPAPAPEPKNKVIKFKDFMTKYAVLSQMKRAKCLPQNAKDITVQDAKKLKWLRLPKSVKRLDWLEYFTNLKDLTLMQSPVADIKPIAKLKNLKSLNLSYNKITDISPLRGLTNLKNLYLMGNKITDISPLRGLTNLEKLQLGKNSITDIRPLSGLKNLTLLNIDRAKINDLTPLKDLTNLELLTIDNTKLVNIDALSHFVKLIRISAENAELPDLKPIGDLVTLKALYMKGAHISDISPFKNLSNLELLDIRGTEVSNIAPITNLLKLKELDIELTKIKDKTQLCKLKSLTDFNEKKFKIPYCVTFKVDGAFFEHFAVEQNCSIKTGMYIDKPFPTAPIKQGFTFKEWNTQPDGNGYPFDDESIITANQDIYAIYTDNNKQPLKPPAPQPPAPDPTPSIPGDTTNPSGSGTTPGATPGTSGTTDQSGSQSESGSRIKPGTYTVSANIWFDKHDTGLPLNPHITNPGFPPMNPVANNARLVVDEDGQASVTFPIAIQPMIMHVKSISGLNITNTSTRPDSSTPGDDITSITIGLGVLSPGQTDITQRCTVHIHLGSVAANIAGPYLGGVLDHNWPATFNMRMSGLPSSGGGSIPPALRDKLNHILSGNQQQSGTSDNQKGQAQIGFDLTSFTPGTLGIAAKKGVTVELNGDVIKQSDAASGVVDVQTCLAAGNVAVEGILEGPNVPDGSVCNITTAALDSMQVASVAPAIMQVLGKELADPQAVAGVFDVSLNVNSTPVHDNFGNLVLSFPASPEYNGKQVKVWHFHVNNTVTSEICTVKDGRFSIAVSDLSKFAYALLENVKQEAQQARLNPQIIDASPVPAIPGDADQNAQGGAGVAGADASANHIAAGTYTVSANIWFDKHDTGLPLNPHITNPGFPPMNPVANNARLVVNEAGEGWVTIPIAIQSRIMNIQSISGLNITQSDYSDGGLRSITVYLGVLSGNRAAIVKHCSATVRIGDLAMTIAGAVFKGERMHTWPATFSLNFSGLPRSGGGRVPDVVKNYMAGAHDNTVANAEEAALDALGDSSVTPQNDADTSTRAQAKSKGIAPDQSTAMNASTVAGIVVVVLALAALCAYAIVRSRKLRQQFTKFDDSERGPSQH